MEKASPILSSNHTATGIPPIPSSSPLPVYLRRTWPMLSAAAICSFSIRSATAQSIRAMAEGRRDAGDLRDCLAGFNIWEFTSMKARDLFVSAPRVIQGTVAWEILEQRYLCPELTFLTALRISFGFRVHRSRGLAFRNPNSKPCEQGHPRASSIEESRRNNVG